jgi:hypothetical protein
MELHLQSVTRFHGVALVDIQLIRLISTKKLTVIFTMTRAKQRVPKLHQYLSSLNPLTPELNPYRQRCPTRFFTWDFAF